MVGSDAPGLGAWIAASREEDLTKQSFRQSLKGWAGKTRIGFALLAPSMIWFLAFGVFFVLNQSGQLLWVALGRAMKLFDFDYQWEVYVPVPKRRWWYYALPILFGDDLVARLDPKLDRTTMTLEIKGFWYEDDAPVKDAAFADAPAHGVIRFAKFLKAEKIDTEAIKPVGLKREVKRSITKLE